MFDRTHYQNANQFTLDCIDEYARIGRPGGGFIHALLTNDLRGAVTQADTSNIVCIYDLVMYCLNQIPADAQGSVEKYEAWVNAGGMRGKGLDDDC